MYYKNNNDLSDEVIDKKDKKIELLFPNIYCKINKTSIKKKINEIKIKNNPVNNLPMVSSVILNKNFKLNKKLLLQLKSTSDLKETNKKDLGSEDEDYKEKYGINKIDIDDLNDPYRKESKIKNNIKLTPLLYNMLKNSKNSYYINDINNLNFNIDKEIEKNYVKKLINFDENIEKIDEVSKERIGIKAVDNYYKHYKNLPKIIDQNRFANKKNNSIYTKLLKSSSEKLLFPEKFGFIKVKGDEYCLNIENYNLNDVEGEIISKGLKEARIRKMFMAKNRFTSISINKMIKNINENLIHLDLSYNYVRNSITVLNDKILQNNLYIKVLKLRKTGLNNKLVNNLLEIVISKLNLKILDLSDNNLNYEICDNINNLLENEEFKELYLRWNNMSNIGANEIFPKLIKSNLAVLDLACNSIGELGKTGKDQFRSSVEEICNFIKKDKNLIHFDLSANYFSLRECIEISEALKKNQSILGFHFSGNYGKIDDEGYLIFDEDSLNNNLKGPIGLIEFDGFRKISGKNENNICWICDEWRQVEIRCKKSIQDEDLPLFAHLDYNNFKPLYIHEIENNTGILNLIVPKTKLIGIFSENFEPIENDFYDKISLNEPKEINMNLTEDISYKFESSIVNIISDNEFENKLLKDFQKKIDKDYLINIKKENIVNIDVQYNYNITISVFPRSLKKYIPPKAKKIKKIWRFETSIFKDYQNDTEELLNKCFEFDFSNTKISSLIKNKDDLEDTKGFLKKLYKKIKDSYKFFASGSLSGIWSISSNLMLELIGDFKIIDKFISIPEYDIIYTGISTEKKFKNDQKSFIVRHKFLELWVRIVNKKYVENQGMKIIDGWELAFKNNFLPIFDKYNHFKWRKDRFWNENCDYLIKFHKQLLDKLYVLYSGSKTMPGKKKFCCLEEFKKMINDSELIGDNLFDRDISTCFNLSIITVKDELNIDRVNECYFLEFIEAIARISEKLSLPPILEGYEKYNWEERINNLPLHLKLESTLKKLWQKLISNSLKKHIKFEEKSFFCKNEED